MNNPNYLLDFKECKEIKDGVVGLLSLSDSVWKEIELNPENEEKWLEVSVLADMAANYSTIYNVWCKDCLLYTSPSPRDMRRSRMPSSA